MSKHTDINNQSTINSVETAIDELLSQYISGHIVNHGLGWVWNPPLWIDLWMHTSSKVYMNIWGHGWVM